MEEKLFEASFDKIAQMYDNIWPAYPKQLFDDIMTNRFSKIISSSAS